MVKIVKKKKKFKIEGLISLFFIFSILSYFMSVTVLRSYNVVLANQERTLENENEILSNEVAVLKLAVKKLDDKNRILKIANEEGLKQNQEKVVSVTND